MSKWLLLGLMLGAIPSMAETRELPSSVSPITLYTRFQRPPSGPIVDAMQDELRSIMAPLGLGFSWRELDPARGSEVVPELAVVTFRGQCNLNGLMPVKSMPGALGWTHISDGAILPFAEVDCDRIRGFLQKALLALPPAHREADFGRAMARVLAHELYHIFANTTHHGSCGIEKSGFTTQELLDSSFQFEDPAQRSFQQARTRDVQTP